MTVNGKKYDYRVSAAGRVNIIGEHIDYCGGRVFPAALSLKNTVYIRANGTNKINIEWTTLPDMVTLDTDKLGEYLSLKYGNYQAGSLLAWKDAGHTIVGCDMLQDCTVPFGSGLSSSAAIEVSTIAAMCAVTGEKIDPVDIALKAQSAERGYLGVNCGIMDQYASACGRAGQAMLLDCATLDCEYVPLELGDCALVLTDCKKPHNLVESKYNERRAESEKALELLAPLTGAKRLSEISPEVFERHSRALPPVIRKRAKHIVEECARVAKAEAAMKGGRMEELGRLLDESHASLRDLYEVTGAELDALAAAAQSHPACLGSRMTGAGFGGCTVSLVKKSGVKDFEKYVLDKYRERTGYEAKIYEAQIGDGITVAKI